MSAVQDSSRQASTRVKVPGRTRNMVVIGGSMTVDGGDNTVVAGLFPAIQLALGLSYGALGLLTSTARLVGVVAGPLWVWIARRTSRKAVLAVATGFWGLWSAAAGLSQDFWQLLVLYTVAAAGSAAGQALVPEIIGDSYDEHLRGRAVGILMGCVAAFSALAAPLVGLLAEVDDGWRYGFLIAGLLNALFGVVILVFYKDPGSGAAEHQLADLDAGTRARMATVTWDKVRSLLRIRSFLVLLASRLLSTHMLVQVFGVVLLVDVYGMSNSVAVLALAATGLGYLGGTLLGGAVSDWVQRLSPLRGRIALLQVVQVVFAVLAYFGTQFDWGGIGLFAVWFAAMGAVQGMNPGVNRPLVMSVVTPELRGAAFAIYVAVVESIGFAAYTLLAGVLADAFGLQTALLWLCVGLMALNGLLLGLAYKPYARDVAAVQRELDERRERALAEEA